MAEVNNWTLDENEWVLLNGKTVGQIDFLHEPELADFRARLAIDPALVASVVGAWRALNPHQGDRTWDEMEAAISALTAAWGATETGSVK